MTNEDWENCLLRRTNTPNKIGRKLSSLLGTAAIALVSGAMGCQAAAPDDKGQNGTGGSGSDSGGQAGDSRLGLGGAEISPELILSEATARTVGRYGGDVEIQLEGTAEAGSLVSVEVTFKDDKGEPVLFFDSDFDGEVDSSVGYLVAQQWPKGDELAVTVTSKNAGRLSELSEIGVALVGRDGRHSETRNTDLVRQEVVEKGKRCDPTTLDNRCAEGLSCAGEPPVCAEGTPPTLDRIAYLRQTDGPIMVASGLDPDEDVIMMRIDFLNSSGDALVIDIDGDGAKDADYFEVQQELKAASGAYTFFNHSAEGFEDIVPRIALTAIDSQGQESPRMSASISTPSPRSSGQSCDALGFAPCKEGNVCVEGNTPGAGTCTSFASGRSKSCSKAPTLDPEAEVTKVSGWLASHGFWQGPAGCFPPIASVGPDAAVKLHLEQDAKRVTLSTAEPETTVDTGLFILSTCDAADDEAIDCGDDEQGFASILTLEDMPAGDYTVVVKSIQPTGGTFGLSLRVE